MAKSDPIGIRLEPSVRAALERAAKADDRSLSAMAHKLLAEALRAAGWLNHDDGRASVRSQPPARKVAQH